MLVTIYRSPTLGVATDCRKHNRNPTPQSEIAVISGAMGLQEPATVSTAGYRRATPIAPGRAGAADRRLRSPTSTMGGALVPWEGLGLMDIRPNAMLCR